MFVYNTCFLNYLFLFNEEEWRDAHSHIYTYVLKQIKERNTSRPVIYAEPLWILEDEEDEGYITE